MTKLADKVSMLPERYGCDAIWRAHNQWWGVQRKELKDLIASMIDGRLGKEVAQMRASLAMPIVVIEGRIQFANGNLIYSGFGQDISERQWHGMLFSLLLDGCNCLFTASTDGTADLIKDLYAWSQKDNHTSMSRRPGPDQESTWGKATNRDWAKHLLQGFPGIGPKVAEDIINHFGGVPLTWTITQAELLKVPGIGKERAKALMTALSSGDLRSPHPSLGKAHSPTAES